MPKRVEKPEWLRVAEEYEASGLTQREFAGRRELRLSTLQSWIYRRRRPVGAEVETPVRLLPVQVSSVPGPATTPLELALPSGVRVRFGPDADIEYLARLVAALERGAC